MCYFKHNNIIHQDLQIRKKYVSFACFFFTKQKSVEYNTIKELIKSYRGQYFTDTGTDTESTWCHIHCTIKMSSSCFVTTRSLRSSAVLAWETSHSKASVHWLSYNSLNISDTFWGLIGSLRSEIAQRPSIKIFTSFPCHYLIWNWIYMYC